MVAETRTLTVEQYFALERDSLEKHEYLRGQVFALAGASPAHNLVTANIGAALNGALKSRPCRVYAADLRIHVPATGLYTYADATAVCGKAQLDEGNPPSLLNPDVIIEVLSESTESYDRGKKFAHYRSIPSLKEYLLVSQKEAVIEQFTRQADGSWLLREWKSGDHVVLALPDRACTIAVDDVFDKVFDLEPG